VEGVPHEVARELGHPLIHERLEHDSWHGKPLCWPWRAEMCRQQLIFAIRLDLQLVRRVLRGLVKCNGACMDALLDHHVCKSGPLERTTQVLPRKAAESQKRKVSYEGKWPHQNHLFVGGLAISE